MCLEVVFNLLHCLPRGQVEADWPQVLFLNHLDDLVELSARRCEGMRKISRSLREIVQNFSLACSYIAFNTYIEVNN